jgi:hypothetical protein
VGCPRCGFSAAFDFIYARENEYSLILEVVAIFSLEQGHPG